MFKFYNESLLYEVAHGTDQRPQIHSKWSRFSQACCHIVCIDCCINLHVHVRGNLGTHVKGIHWDCMWGAYFFVCTNPLPPQLLSKRHVTCHVGARSFCHMESVQWHLPHHLPNHYLAGKRTPCNKCSQKS
jgi:hypothetical protein